VIDEETVQNRPRRSRPTAAVAAGLVLLVAVAAVVGYERVVPVTNSDRTRLARLVSLHPGVARFDVKPANAAEIPLSRSGLSVLTDAAKKSSGKTGGYLVEWVATGSNNAAEAVAFLAPDDKTAGRLLNQVVTGQLSPEALTRSGLERLATGTVAGVPGSSLSFYGDPKMPASSQLAVTAFRMGSVVAISEAAATSAAREDATTITTTQYRHLRSVSPGFTLSVTRLPLTASIVWAAGSLVVALAAGLAPYGVARARRRRREQLEAEERARQSIVRGHRITKHKL